MTADDPRPVPPPPLHPDLDTLADLDAGVLDGPPAERVSGHVGSCVRCAGALRAVSAVQEDLRALPTPQMPAAVAARLDDVLAGLRHADRPDGTAPGGIGASGTGPGGTAPLPVTGGPDRPDPGHRGPDRPGPHPGGADRRGPDQRSPASDLDSARERRRRRLTRIAGSVAAAVAVLAAAGSVTVLVRAVGSGGTSDDSAVAGGGAEQAPAAASASSGPAVSGYDVPSYSKESLRGALSQIEQQSAVDVITGRGDTGPAGAMADTARRTACVGSIRGSSGELQAVRRVVYEGSMAYVFVFSDRGRRTAYVVADDCGTTPALPASVLDTVP